jgi:nitroreductase
MEAFEALRGRRSIRAYIETPLEREQLEAIVDAGRLAATGKGVQPWEFVVVTDRAARAHLAQVCEWGKYIAQAPACIVTLCRDTEYYLEDGAAATQNMLVAAYALGLGSCWVAGDKRPYAQEVARLVGAPEGYRVVSLMALGRPAENLPPRRAKRKLEEVLHWENF